MGSGGSSSGGGAGGLPPWVHIPKPSSCSGPSSFGSTCKKKSGGAKAKLPSWVASSIPKKSPCSGPSGMNATCNPNAKKAASSSSSSTGDGSLTIAELAKVYEAEEATKKKDSQLK